MRDAPCQYRGARRGERDRQGSGCRLRQEEARYKMLFPQSRSATYIMHVCYWAGDHRQAKIIVPVAGGIRN